MDSFNYSDTKPSYRGAQFARLILGLVETLLAIRFVLKLLGLKADYGFTGFIYNATQPFVSPFLKTIGIYQTKDGVLEWVTLLAMVAYWLITWAIIKIFLTNSTISTAEAERKLK